MTSLHQSTATVCKRALLPLCVSAALSPVASADNQGLSGAELDPIVVSAGGFSQVMKTAPASISVISREELQERSFSSVSEAVADVPGVDVDGSFSKTGGRDISIRGMPADQTLILIDGQRQNTGGSTTPNGFGTTRTNFLPPASAIERIEVIRGPMSTLYGSDAMGGVINIITRPVSEEWGAELRTEHSFQQESEFGNTSQTSLYASGPLAGKSLGLSLRGSIWDRQGSRISYRDENGDEVVPTRGNNPVQAKRYTLGSRLDWAVTDTQTLWLDAFTMHQRYDNDNGEIGTVGNRGYKDELTFSRDALTLGHKGQFGHHQWESSLMHKTTETEGRTIPESFDPSRANEDRTLEARDIVLDTKLNANVGAHMVTLGGQLWEAELDEGILNGPTLDQTQWSVFAEDEWALARTLTLTLGARHTHHSEFEGETTPRAYLAWNPEGPWIIKGGVSEGYKAPELKQISDSIYGVRAGVMPQLGNPDLEPETSRTSEISFLYDGGQPFDGSITLFYNDFEDKIEAPLQTGCAEAGIGDECASDGRFADSFFQPINVAEAYTRGIELGTRFTLAPDWSLKANYTYTDSEQEAGPSKGDPLTDAPDHRINARINWQANSRLNLWVRGDYRSERYRYAGRSPEVREQLGDYEAYALFDLGATYDVSEAATVRAKLHNVFNKDFVNYTDYQTSGGETEFANTYQSPFPGRHLSISANIRF